MDRIALPPCEDGGLQRHLQTHLLRRGCQGLRMARRLPRQTQRRLQQLHPQSGRRRLVLNWLIGEDRG